MGIIDRILQIPEYYEINVSEFSKIVGVSNGYFAKQKSKEASVGSKILEKIVKTYPEINTTWLLTGEGEIFKTKGTENVRVSNPNENPNKNTNKPKVQNSLGFDERRIQQMTPVILEMPEAAIENAVAVPVLPVEAAAGSGAFNMDYHEDVDTLLLPKSFLSPTRRARYCIDVRGESMEPTLMDRTRLVIRQLDRAEWGTIRDGAVYVVTDCDGKTFVKRIRNRLKERGVLRLMSDNPDHEQYKTFELSETEILHVWKIELYIADQMPPTARRSGGIRAELDTLRDRLDELESLLR